MTEETEAPQLTMSYDEARRFYNNMRAVALQVDKALDELRTGQAQRAATTLRGVAEWMKPFKQTQESNDAAQNQNVTPFGQRRKTTAEIYDEYARSSLQNGRHDESPAGVPPPHSAACRARYFLNGSCSCAEAGPGGDGDGGPGPSAA